MERQFEEERGKVKQLRLDMDSFKQREKREREKAERIARGQREALEKEYSNRMVKAEKAVRAVVVTKPVYYGRISRPLYEYHKDYNNCSLDHHTYCPL